MYKLAVETLVSPMTATIDLLEAEATAKANSDIAKSHE
jgi:hypothetical protein